MNKIIYVTYNKRFLARSPNECPFRVVLPINDELIPHCTAAVSHVKCKGCEFPEGCPLDNAYICCLDEEK